MTFFVFLPSEPIKNVALTVSNTKLVEFNDSVTFTCTAQGTPLQFSWYNGSSLVTAASHVQFINDKSGLIINNVTRYDSRNFSCSVANGISNGTSGSIFLNVSCEYIILFMSMTLPLHSDFTLEALFFLYSMDSLM